MSYETCPKCESFGGTVCATCGTRRDRKKPGRSAYEGHSRCKRRPHGVVPCPEHVLPMIRCDSCGVRTAMERNHNATLGFDAPSGYTTNWYAQSTLHHCPNCSLQLDIVRDAVGGLDFAAVGARAVDNLMNGLKRIDFAALTDLQASHLGLALTIAVDGLSARKAKARHARRHPDAAKA